MGFFGRSKKKPAPEGGPSSKLDPSVSPPHSHSQISPQHWHSHDGSYPTPAPGQHPSYLLPPPPPPPQPPSSWNVALPPGSAPPPYHNQQQYPIVVNQHYYYGSPVSRPPPPNQYPYGNGSGAISKLKLGSTVNVACELIPGGNIAHQMVDDGLPRWHAYSTQLLNQSAAICDQIYSSLNNVITLIDGDKYVGNESELFSYQSHSIPPPPNEPPQQQVVVHKGHSKKSKKEPQKDIAKGQSSAIASSLASKGYFAKVELYANSKLPSDLPPLRLYVFFILCP